MRRFLLVILLTACSSSGTDRAEPDLPDAGGDDDGMTIDGGDGEGEVDAGLAGETCVAEVVEVARIVGASIRPFDIGFFGPNYRRGVFTGDADGDGAADFTVVEQVAGQGSDTTLRVRVFPRTAEGFGPPRSSEIVLPSPELQAFGDVTGDGRVDVVFSHTTPLPRVSELHVAVQTADGGFALAAPRDVSACRSSDDERIFAVGLVDVDQDGKRDVLTTTSYEGLGAPPDGLSLLRGTEGGLAASDCLATGGQTDPGFPAELAAAMSLSVLDFDGDGQTDLLARFSSPQAGYDMKYFRRTGTSTFDAVPGYSTYLEGFPFLDNVGGRSRQGMLTMTIRETTTVTRYPVSEIDGVGAGSVVSAVPEGDASGWENVAGLAVGDFNGDELTDVIVAGHHTASGEAATFAVTCDRASRWDVVTGAFPSRFDYVHRIDYDGVGGSELVARSGSDVVVFGLR